MHPWRVSARHVGCKGVIVMQTITRWMGYTTNDQTELHVWELVAPLIAAIVLWPFYVWPLLGGVLQPGGGALIYGTAACLWILGGKLELKAKCKRVLGVFIASFITAFTLADLWDRLMGY